MDKKVLFEAHYQQHYEAIYKFCFRFLNSRESALDITQETFVKLFERMNQQGIEVENTKAWLYKVAGNLCINVLNRAGRNYEAENQVLIHQVETTTPESILIHNENADLIRNILGQLKPESRLLIMMYQDGLSYREMSEATGISINSVGKTLWRIIEKISATIKTKNHE
jgi:RNA polymerase sigma-70 factor (ECF subfamily)